MEELVELLKKNHLTIASCESLTGGLFASSIVSIPGASKVFVGSYVTYQNVAKENILGARDILSEYGAISQEMATKMALKAQEDFNSDIAISFTGNAGPSAEEGKDVGLTYITIVIKDKVYNYKYIFSGTRLEIRNQCVEEAVSLLKGKIH